MFVKLIKAIEDDPLKAAIITNDPHGRLMAFHLCQGDKIYITSYLLLLQLFEGYRRQYAQTKKYSLQRPLKSLLKIDKLRPFSNIQLMRFSHNLKETQFLIVAYFSSSIDLHSTITGEVIHTIKTEQALMSLNVIGHSIYFNYYDFTLSCFQGNQLTQIKKKSMIFMYDSRTKKKLPVYQTGSSTLMFGSEVLQPGEEPKTTEQEYVYHEVKPAHLTYLPFKITLCNQFIVCSDGEGYKVRSREKSWKVVYESTDEPIINHFNRTESLEETLMAEVMDGGNGIRVSCLTKGLVCRLTDLKHGVLDIWWVGPRMLLFLDNERNVFYVELSRQAVEEA